MLQDADACGCREDAAAKGRVHEIRANEVAISMVSQELFSSLYQNTQVEIYADHIETSRGEVER